MTIPQRRAWIARLNQLMCAGALAVAACAQVACSREGAPKGREETGGAPRDNADARLTVFAAGSLARPMREALDSFSRRRGIEYTLESAGSLELARRLTDLGKSADVVALADEEVFPRLLMPSTVRWYARFARNRMVLAHALRASQLDSAGGDGWRRALLRPGVQVGRSDPDLDPAGYRALLLFQLAERHFGDAGLASRLRAAAPPRNVRPKSADLVALLQARELDYAWMYESSARGARLPFIALPPEIDLGDESFDERYHGVSVRVMGARIGDTLVVHGTPIRYGITIPAAAPHSAMAADFLQYLFSSDGQRVLRGQFLDTVAPPLVIGTDVPPAIGGIRGSAHPPLDSIAR